MLIVVEKPKGGRARAPSPANPDSSGHHADIEANDLQEETSIGIDGQVYFYGRTSLYHIDPQKSPRDEARDDGSLAYGSNTRPEEQNEMAAFLAEISPVLLHELLATYWCWPHHLHCVLVKKVFLPARYSPRPDAKDVGERFAKRALELLVKEIDRGSSIATLQGLLIFSARECACGRTSQGWLYSGMAFRMARDLGLHVDPKKLGPLSSQFSDEDLALRQQMFWSCYAWDKTMSLCLGRAPTILEAIELPTADTLLDGRDADDEIWQPVLVQGSLSEGIVRHRALSSTRFAAYCELCTIIQDVLDTLYSRPHRAERDDMLVYLTKTLEKLENWSSRLPHELLVQQDLRAVLCPPLHILLLNLLYHTTVILLCRPYRGLSAAAKARCTDAARATDMLFTLHVRRFGFRCITWLQTYTMFVACTINVRDLKESQEAGWLNDGDTTLAHESGARLDFGMEILRQAGSTPSASRCALIISQLLQGQIPKNGAPQATEQGQALSNTMGSPAMATENKRLPSPAAIKGSGEEASLSSLPAQPIVQRESRDQSRQIDFSHAPPLLCPGNSEQDTATLAYQGEASLSNGTFLGRGHIALDPKLCGSGVETPFRWLPENVCDDGSWMLMDMEFNPNLTYHNSQQVNDAEKGLYTTGGSIK
ncbi:nitrogen assimilation transcription factor nira [Trichoderma arundinaceum]|uniref:Nitrogen assimilation transcription factor nira n=1 Tax=Trichoderma arundinaceum TaxID=490622 RepID=A0A395NCA6_TRIAR|nr:nitrogen assimilation transcription factor nira [Trichoderma arundinaceum]